MKASILLIAAFAGAALAHPASLVEHTSSACPNKFAKDGPELKKHCSDQRPLCCSTPSALTGGLCVNPVGIKEDR
ncbi:hypothetical protein N7486_010610 [Penicillium sp. IBT 16267x]|nr:hypothetical protein N7486_010610 [Penicillium sp. IBT 16267x]